MAGSRKKIKIAGIVIALIVLLQVALVILYRDLPREELEKKYAAPPSKFTEIMGHRVHYRDEGTGVPLVLLHGVFSSLHTWDAWAAKLKEHYRVIRLDLPGWGLTGAAPFRYERGEYMKFLKAFFDKLGVDSMYLGGNSFGGYLSWCFTVGNPGRVRKLLLIDAGGYPNRTPWPIRLLTTPVAGSLAARITPRFMVETNIKDVYGDEKNIKEGVIDRYYDLIMAPGNRSVTGAIFESLHRENSEEPGDVKNISVPTLILWGRNDRWIPLKLGYRFRDDIKGSKLIVYDGVGHVPMEEIPDKSLADVERFLAE